MGLAALPVGRGFESIATAGVLVIGCGAVGSVIARHLCTSDEIGEIALADIDETLPRKLAAREDMNKARPMRLDASRREDVERAMEGLDLVVNAVVPRFNEAIRGAALNAGLDYLDLATESNDPYTNSKAWEDAGRVGVLGMGEDPGLSNLMARAAADRLDTIESVKVRDGDTASSPDHPFVALFSPETFVEETLHTSRIWREARYEDVLPFGAAETYRFPEPVGPLPVYSVDHEEVDSLPRFIGKGVQYVDFKLALDDATVAALRNFQALLSRGGSAEARRAWLAKIPKPADLTGVVDGHAVLVVEVVGTRDGERRRHILSTSLGHREAASRYGATGTAYLTGTPAAVVAILLATGRVPRRGLLAPEQLDPEPFFRMLGQRGIPIRWKSSRAQ